LTLPPGALEDKNFLSQPRERLLGTNRSLHRRLPGRLGSGSCDSYRVPSGPQNHPKIPSGTCQNTKVELRGYHGASKTNRAELIKSRVLGKVELRPKLGGRMHTRTGKTTDKSGRPEEIESLQKTNKAHSLIDSRESIIIYLSLTLSIVMSLQNILSSGYYGDDLVTSTFKGEIELNNTNCFTHIINYVTHIAYHGGRFIPISLAIMILVNYFIPSLFYYKLFILIMVIINIYLFGFFIMGLKGDKYLSYILMALAPSFFQFRIYHDPILSYSALQQTFFAFLMISLIFLYKFFQVKSKKYLIISVASFNLLLYTYELGFIFILVYLFAILCSKLDFKQKLNSLLPFLFLFFIAMLVNIFIRTRVKIPDSGYDGVTFNLNIMLMFKTFIIQAYSAIPLSYYISNPSKLFGNLYSIGPTHFNYGAIISMIIFSSIYFYCVNKLKFEGTGKNGLIFGFAMLILPASMICLSRKYQQEFLLLGGMGIGYLPVYIQYYGVLIVFSVIILSLNKWLNGTSLHFLFNISLLIMINALIYVNIRNNTLVIERLNYDMHYRRTVLEKALKNGILDKVPENSTLIVKDNYDRDPFPSYVTSFKGWTQLYEWNSSNFFYLTIKKRYKVIRKGSDIASFYESLNKKSLNKLENLYEISILSYPDTKDGYVLIRKIIY
jgi:hypothetical protein